jgi:photosystem II stability/assembly factor-like uncharacterized protein
VGSDLQASGATSSDLAIEPGPFSALGRDERRSSPSLELPGSSNWTRIDAGQSRHFVSAIAFDPASHGTVYAGTNDGVRKSTDEGAHWTDRSSGLSNRHVTCLTLEPGTPTAIYAGTNSGGVFRSTNGGDSWTTINSGLGSSFIWSLVATARPKPMLYAATYEGLFRSADRGAHWTSLSRGLRSTFVLTVAIDPQSPTMYAGTAGVFISRFSNCSYNHWCHS